MTNQKSNGFGTIENIQIVKPPVALQRVPFCLEFKRWISAKSWKANVQGPTFKKSNSPHAEVANSLAMTDNVLT